MCNNILSVTDYGLSILTDKVNISIDAPANIFTPDVLLFSNPQSLYTNISITNNLPSFAAKQTKTVAKKILASDNNFFENVIECDAEISKTFRKKLKNICEFTFYPHKSKPEMSAVLINTENKSILYIKGEVPDIHALPHHDIMVINSGKKTPVYPIIKTLSEFVVHITDFSKMCNVLKFFNQYESENTVGLDSSVLPMACEYLKLNFTVFSKTIKPLSFYNTPPKVIITSSPELYNNRPIIPDYTFFSGMSLSDIYTLASLSDANRIIAICPGFLHARTIKNLTLCSKNTITQI